MSAHVDLTERAPARLCAWLAPVIFLLAGCGTPGHPTEHGASLLPGTEGVEARSLDMVSLSPAGTLLLVPLAAGGSDHEAAPADREVEAALVAGLGRSVLYDLVTGVVRPTRVDEAALTPLAVERPELFLGETCWSVAGDVVYLGRTRRDALALAVGDAEPEWRLVKFTERDAPDCPPPPARGEQLLGRHGRFVVERAADGGIRVRASRSPERVLLEYGGTLLGPDTGISDVLAAPDGQRLAIVLSRGLGSFAGPLELLVISVVAGEPSVLPLGGPAYKIRWTPDGRALLVVSRLPDSAELAVYRWQP